MILSSENWQDINKYYKGTFVKCKESGDRIWKITGVDCNEVSMVDVAGFNVHIDLTEGDYELDFILPSRAVFQLGQYAALIRRIPARQYSRGISSTNTGFFLLKDGKWYSSDLTMDVLQQFADKPCYQSLEFFPDDFYSYALSPQFSVDKCGLLFCVNVTIGHVDFTQKRVSVNKLFLEDVKDYFKGFKIE